MLHMGLRVCVWEILYEVNVKADVIQFLET
jgi:hypothetical protein